MTLYTRFSPLFTDLYELTMAAGYYAAGMDETATFSLFVRGQKNRGYYVFTGLDQVVSGLLGLRFADDEIRFLEKMGLFKDDFLEYLSLLRFTGNVKSMAEGEIFFPEEPVLEITAPIIQAQIIETYLINTISVSTLLTTKAARCIHAAKGIPLIDFSLRRTHGADAGMAIARSSYIAGFSGTSNVLAGKTLQIPISGTMAHSYVMAFKNEAAAFSHYADQFPDNAVFLIDTYDTIKGAETAVKVAREMKKKGHSLSGVRLDSGDMAQLSKKVRAILDNAGLHGVKILASSGFDEYKIDAVLRKGALIDGFGVGTAMGVSADAPFLDMVYKMVCLGKRDVRKLSSDKITLAGKKQVFRLKDNAGVFLEDIIGSAGEEVKGGIPLLKTVINKGKCTLPMPALETIRNRFQSQFKRLGEGIKDNTNAKQYPVTISRRLKAQQQRLYT